MKWTGPVRFVGIPELKAGLGEMSPRSGVISPELPGGVRLVNVMSGAHMMASKTGIKFAENALAV
ncbi:uncharacterized protein DNG_04489 [Cephalotrichum gorgonifer]|uniref:Uncharacterized protein n=1 Tax=Cephalotrichum gorgonifer TaxID=2041049 RepID=A0AAE8SUL8_9PEZI|nr:uncharacterized protein DNG_04489 [Cephalotrichum gorgonifer]